MKNNVSKRKLRQIKRKCMGCGRELAVRIPSELDFILQCFGCGRQQEVKKVKEKGVLKVFNSS